MRFLLSVLLALMLAAAMPAARIGGALAETSPMVPAVAPSVSAPAHECCHTRQERPHGDCAACAAIVDTDVVLTATRIPRGIRYDALSPAVKAAAPRLPLPPPRI